MRSLKDVNGKILRQRRHAPRFTKKIFLDGLKNDKFKNIAVLTGAGISVSAGIPDFRSPKTGIYDNLQEYDLPFPGAVFELGFFNAKPQAFYKLASSYLDLDKFRPTKTHHFCYMLVDKSMVSYYLT